MILPMSSNKKKGYFEVNTTPKSEALTKYDETSIYKTIKAQREADGLPVAKIDKNDGKTLKNLILTKPPVQSPINQVTSGGAVLKPTNINEDKKLTITPTQAFIKTTATPVSTTAKVLSATTEKAADWIIKKPIVKSSTDTALFMYGTMGMLQEAGKTIYDDNSKLKEGSTISGEGSAFIPQQTAVLEQRKTNVENYKKEVEKSGLNLFQRGILNTADKFEDRKAKTEILFGTKLNAGDYLSLHSSEEKRRQVIAEAAPDKQASLQKFYDDNTITTGVIDVTSGLAAGLITGSAFANYGASLGATSSLGKTMYSLGTAVEKGVMPAQGILGATMAIQAAAYYGSTGDYLFKDDKEATEAMFGGLLYDSFKIGGKSINYIMNNETTRKYFTATLESIKKAGQETFEGLGDKIDDFAMKQGYISGIMPPGNKVSSSTNTVVNKNIYEDINITPELQAKIDKLNTPVKVSVFGKIYQGAVDKIKDSGLYDYNKNAFTNIVNYNFTKLGDIFFNKDNEKLLKVTTGKVDKGNLATLNQYKNTARISYYTDIIKKLVEGGDLSEEDVLKLNNYLNFKSRYTQYVNKEEGMEKAFIQEVNDNILKLEKQKEDIISRGGKADDIDILINKEKDKLNYSLKDYNAKVFNEDIDKKISSITEVINNTKGALSKVKEGSERYVKLNETLKAAQDSLNKQLALKEQGYTHNVLSQVYGGESFSKDDLAKYIQLTELSSPHLVEIANSLYGISRAVLDEMLDGGLISKDLYDNLSKNPFYISTKLSADDLKEIKNLNFSGDKLVKKLGEGLSEDSGMSFSTEAIQNMYAYTSHAMYAVRKNKYINDIVDITNGLLEEGKKPGLGYTEVTYMKDGVPTRGAIPNFIAEQLNKSIQSSDNPMFTVLQKATSLLKKFQTGLFHPVFAIGQAPTEMATGLAMVIRDTDIKNAPKDIFNYLSTTARALGGKVTGDKKEQLISDFTSAMGADFGFGKTVKGELSADSLYYKKSNMLNNAVSGVERFMANVDKWGSRAPLFMTNLLGQLRSVGKDRAVLTDILERNNVDGIINVQAVVKELKDIGVDANVAADYARSMFDYTSASNIFKTMGLIIPYLNIIPVTADSTLKFIKNNPAGAAKILAAYQGISAALYNYNNGIGDWDNEDGKKRREVLDNLPGGRYMAGVAIPMEDGTVDFSKPFLKNNTMFNLSYILHAFTRDIQYDKETSTDMFNQISKEVAGVDFAQGPARAILTRLTPPVAKELIELTNNKSLKYGNKIYTEGAGANDTKGVSKLSLFISSALNGDNLDELGMKKGNVNPKVIDNLLQSFSPKRLDWVFSDKKTEEIVPYLIKLLGSSTYKVPDKQTNELYDIKEKQANEYTKFTTYTNNSIDNVKNLDELTRVGKLLLVGSAKQKDKKKFKYIEGKMKDKFYELNGLKNKAKLKNISGEVLGEYITHIHNTEGEGKVREYIKNNLMGQVSIDKLNKMIEVYLKNTQKNKETGE